MRKWKIALGTAVALGAISVASVHLLDMGNLSLNAGTAAATPAPAAFVMPVPVVSVVKKTIPIYLDYAARTEPIRSITLQARIPGYLQEQTAADGVDVRQGDLLYKISPDDFQAALDQAKAQVQRDTATLDYARSNLGRGTELAKSGYLAKDGFDQRTSTLREAQASLAVNQAAVRTAELNLSYAEIRAPFAGRLGRNQASVGTLVSVAGTVLNTLVQLDPIYVTFNPSETDLAEIEQARANGPIEVEVLLPGQTEASQKGELTFIDNSVDRSTGTITARATIGNGKFTLLPGQYVRVRLHVREQADALMVPQTALGSSQLGKYLYVVGKDNTVDQRLVSLGPTSGGQVAILSGVAEGDQVITGNLQKIGPGAPVSPIPEKPAT
ncbi:MULTISPECIES: efflux RND transporter periplasmic adaptor subunit [unclassified Mesorhizobium]|jgi:membrane fusion protein, multidrug efflux system|uniref:efflux RND transporter periplasmic adaptor subunit n=3 Tax=Mesorhizobium TaxID=68287 RepID=UPI000FCC0D0A|nr:MULTISPECIES: efflux RND transporter periplasmic adaptor subunit [unclassified Mesorhizobium]RUU66738.1 efflux RND transporter periplasmic adaptor subunit [Mesorhizobium sp. M7A.T.Ca.TU.009.01.1.1]RUU85154.1 efflux RND transporter periplasmic adaptor subunit [Mesorhizobium sp. M7A.T.Ca.TU.009.01.1.2]AZV23199.1 efflux RND transporter periplasmic adaptor subunit [Mesorhizobium sp. M7A.F.Ce.TU.012.03.2.1]MCQ8871387.1 efflux RND transporter periplasmic adaptor subunit [Mesorhizobium sp. LMG17149